ncbi:MAG TPA: hypothetical protein VGD87_06655, partial [Archangium sp.]
HTARHRCAMTVILEHIAELGRELARLGWKKHLEAAREAYRAKRDGTKAEWGDEQIARLRSALGLGESALKEGRACPRCPPPTPGHWTGKRTMLHLPDRWVSACADCGAEWVTRERPGG